MGDLLRYRRTQCAPRPTFESFGASTRFRLQIGLFPRCEQSFGSPHHYVQGRRYRLDIVATEGRQSVALRDASTLELRLHPDTSAAEREQLLQRWYRRLLRPQVAELIAKWEPILGVEVADWGIKKMKTRWGTCNTEAGRIWINLELAKKSPACLEYIVVHELVHRIERRHNDQFRELMDRHLPQ